LFIGIIPHEINKAPVEQLEKDIEQATGTLKEAKAGAAKLRNELATLAQELSASEVCQPVQLRHVAADSLPMGIGFACQSGEEATGGTCHPHPLRQRAERARRRNKEQETGGVGR
jgi:hypothetical protein